VDLRRRFSGVLIDQAPVDDIGVDRTAARAVTSIPRMFAERRRSACLDPEGDVAGTGFGGSKKNLCF